MLEWVNKAHDLMVERSGLRQSMIKLAVADGLSKKNIALRSGVPQFLTQLHQHEVPILIFSAGLGDVIEEVLKQQSILSSPHLHIVSNHMIFRDDRLVGFTQPSYHVFNKTAQSALHSPFFAQHHLLTRQNLILIGDSLGDITMANGLHFEEESILRIGFLNEKPERLPEYLAVYDVVIFGDPGFEIPNHILSGILKK
jgi:HAD superfamily hydrolase (TIGR01544 family)